MKERIFNLFYYVQDNTIYELGVVVHFIDGSDEEKSLFLKNAVDRDFENSKRFPLCSNIDGVKVNTLSIQYFTALARQGKTLKVFEHVFREVGANVAPLCCITAILDGRPEIDIGTSLDPLYLSKHQGHPKLGSGVMSDYLEDYMTPEGFDLPSLLNKDYFLAIKLLFNNKHYVSCVKLLSSFIDTLAFLEYGDVKNNFIDWLNQYAKLESIGITSSQLWELRNSILHMTNLDSRRVLSGHEKRISFCIAKSGLVSPGDHETEYFNLYDLINIIADALSRWIASINDSPNKMTKFIERYDRILSDDRHAILKLSE